MVCVKLNTLHYLEDTNMVYNSSSCVRREHCRGSDLTDTTSREPSHSTAPSHHSPAPACLRLRINRKNDPPSRHSSSLSATGFLDNRSNTTPNSDSLSSDISRGCTPQELPPVEVFLTAKQRVIEKYQMKFPEITGGLPSQPIKETAIRGQKARKVMDLPKPRVTTTAEKLKTAVPLKKSRANAATLAQASSRVDARKSINGCTLSDILSAREPPKHNTRMTVMNISQPKKPVRKGPAIKHARGSISRVFITDDSSSESDHSGKLRALEKRLQDQKSYTKNQAEKAAKLQVKLQESEKEKAALQEKLKAFLALGNHGANERPALGNENPQPGVITELFLTQEPQQEPPKKKALKRLVRWEEAHSDRTTPREDPQTEPGAANDKPDTNKKAFRYGSMRDFYSGSKFCGEDPWAYPTIPEQPEPDPSTFRKHGWRKTVYRPFDQGRLMKVHLHRLTSHSRPPLTMTIEENPLGDDDEFAGAPNTPIGTRADKPEDERDPIEAPRVISFDEFMGLPENMVPTVKDGCLGFRSGIIVSFNYFSTPKMLPGKPLLIVYRILALEDLRGMHLTTGFELQGILNLPSAYFEHILIPSSTFPYFVSSFFRDPHSLAPRPLIFPHLLLLYNNLRVRKSRGGSYTTPYTRAQLPSCSFICFFSLSSIFCPVYTQDSVYTFICITGFLKRISGALLKRG